MLNCIYKIKSKSDEADDNIYIGSTDDLKQRMRHHKLCCKTAPNRRVYKYINENGGWNTFEVSILELTDGYSQIERRLLEQSYINELAPSLNCFNALGLNQDKLRDKYRRYYIKHIDKIKEKKKERINCCCGSSIQNNHIQRHYRSKKHLQYVLQNPLHSTH